MDSRVFLLRLCMFASYGRVIRVGTEPAQVRCLCSAVTWGGEQTMRSQQLQLSLLMKCAVVLTCAMWCVATPVCVAQECPDTHCAADLDGDDSVDVNDILLLLGHWGSDGPGACIAPSNTIVDINDLLGLLAGWGSCPPPPDPDNDLCIGAMDLGLISTTTTIQDSMVNATTDDDLGLCEGVAVEGPGRWYRIIGNGESCLVTTCTEGNDDVPFDLRLNAFCGSCDLLNCVIATNGDDCGAAQSVRGSWNSVRPRA